MNTSKLIWAVVSILIDEGQHDPKFNWGDTIRYSPSEVGDILRRRADELEDEMEEE